MSFAPVAVALVLLLAGCISTVSPASGDGVGDPTGPREGAISVTPRMLFDALEGEGTREMPATGELRLTSGESKLQNANFELAKETVVVLDGGRLVIEDSKISGSTLRHLRFKGTGVPEGQHDLVVVRSTIEHGEIVREETRVQLRDSDWIGNLQGDQVRLKNADVDECSNCVLDSSFDHTGRIQNDAFLVVSPETRMTGLSLNGSRAVIWVRNLGFGNGIWPPVATVPPMFGRVDRLEFHLDRFREASMESDGILELSALSLAAMNADGELASATWTSVSLAPEWGGDLRAHPPEGVILANRLERCLPTEDNATVGIGDFIVANLVTTNEIDFQGSYDLVITARTAAGQALIRATMTAPYDFVGLRIPQLEAVCMNQAESPVPVESLRIDLTFRQGIYACADYPPGASSVDLVVFVPPVGDIYQQACPRSPVAPPGTIGP